VKRLKLHLIIKSNKEIKTKLKDKDEPTMINTQLSNRERSNHIHTGTLVALGLIAAVMIFGSIIGVAVFLGINKVKDEGPTPARFYMALQDHNYALAYSFMDGDAKLNNQPVDQQTFIQKAALADAQSASIKGFDYKDNANSSSVTVNVHRGNSNYQTHITMKQVEGRWVITAIDRL
jgi:hypothetical protein